LRTELTAIPSSRAISVLFEPSAAANTIRDRNASAWALVRRRSRLQLRAFISGQMNRHRQREGHDHTTRRLHPN
jgi:hypothetical protein